MVMGFGRSFSQGGGSLCPKAFFQGANSDEISFYQLETQRKTFFTENVMRNCQISKSRGLSLCTPFRHSWSWLTELRNPKFKPTPLFERCFIENSKTRRRDWKLIPRTVWRAIIQQDPLEIDYHSFFKAIIF